MSAPLAVRLDGPDGSRYITKLVRDVAMRSVDPGGFASVEVEFEHPIAAPLLAGFSDILVFDTRTGEQVGGGRLFDQGRRLDATQQVRGLTALGEGLASMQDIEQPYFLIDSGTSNWVPQYRSFRRINAAPSPHPDSSVEMDGLLFEAVEGLAVYTGAYVRMVNRVAALCGQEVGSLGFRHDAGASTGQWVVRWQWWNGDLSAGGGVRTEDWSSTMTSRARAIRSNPDTNVRNVAAIQWERTGAAQGAGEQTWNLVNDPIVQARTLERDGSFRTASWYDNEYVRAHEVFVDLLARFCPRLDAINARIELAEHPFTQLCWIDGITPAGVMDEILETEEAFTWAAWEKNADTGKWSTEFRAYSTEVRYEADVEDGFNGPSPQDEVYDGVAVRGRTTTGREAVTYRYREVPDLAAAGVRRMKTIDLGDEVYSAATAAKRGDAFLATHKNAPNAGTLTVARRVRDADTGRLVMPYQIRPGELIRVRGLQPSADLVNPSGSNGSTVFRIVANNYSSATGRAELELDAFTFDERQALAELYTKRRRKR